MTDVCPCRRREVTGAMCAGPFPRTPWGPSACAQSATRAAWLLGVAPNRMAMSQVFKLLNVEGHPVMVATDPTTQAVTLDASLLAEQYGVRV